MPALPEENSTLIRHRDSVAGEKTLSPDAAFVDANRIKLDITYITNPIDDKPFISIDEIEQFAPTVVEQHRKLTLQVAQNLNQFCAVQPQGWGVVRGWLLLKHMLTKAGEQIVHGGVGI